MAVGAAVAVPPGPRGEGGGGSPLPFDGRSPQAPASAGVRVLVELGRPALGGAGGPDPGDAEAQRAYVRSLGRESRALRSALAARGVRLGDPVTFARTWNGFAATVASEDLPEVETLGLRAEPVRRFYPATAPTAGSGLAIEHRRARLQDPTPPREGAQPALGLLDSGVDLRHRALGGRVLGGYDALRRRAAAPPPGEHGTAVAGVLAAALAPDERVLAVRVAGRPAGGGGERGHTDDLLLGLERAVDPDGDGDTDDALPVALVGVNAPYAGFARAPEAEAVGAARRLGTLVVAPAGNDGARLGAFGTVGSPAAAPGALGVGVIASRDARPGLPGVRLGLASREGRALLEGTLLVAGRPSGPASDGGDGSGDGPGPFRAPLTGLVGPSQADPRERGRALGGDPLEYFDAAARRRGRGAVVVVPAAAAAAGPRRASPPAPRPLRAPAPGRSWSATCATWRPPPRSRGARPGAWPWSRSPARRRGARCG